MDKKQALDLLFGQVEEIESNFQELKDLTDEDNVPISSHTCQDKSLLQTVKQRVDEFKEHNNLTVPEEEKLISTKNSDNALPDELSKESGVPFSTEVTQGIHLSDDTDNEELICTHSNTDISNHSPIVDSSEEIHIISNINSSKFVDEE